jgi:D-alanyl-lipoteichoic acid acyltransferase DltB (MBOAT superfamily)
MAFISVEFIAFFIVVLCLYWTVGLGSAIRQNIILLLAGLFFYGWADLRFLALIIFSAGANYGLGVAIEKAKDDTPRRLWLWTGIILNIGLLGYFKYFSFFYDSFVDALNLVGGHHGHLVLAIALPLGISYYTFQVTGYLIDVFNGTSDACRKPIHFLTYVLHFPKMLAGPVEPARDFLPRIEKARTFDPAMTSDALRQILWGVFAKVVIADNCATMVNPVFKNMEWFHGSTLFIGAMLYLIQLFADFSGYSNMAIGLSKLFGIPLMVNFRAPLFVTNIGEFWRKWHISLTTWMMEYVFTPLSFLLREKGRTGLAISILATFLAVGIWHGANWTFIIFGLLQGLYFLPLVFKGTLLRSIPLPNVRNKRFAKSRHIGAMIGMFVLMSITFVLVRAPTLGEAWKYWANMLSPSLLASPEYTLDGTFFMIALFLFIEYRSRTRDHALASDGRPRSWVIRWAWFSFILFLIGMYASTHEAAFIYFKF